MKAAHVTFLALIAIMAGGIVSSCSSSRKTVRPSQRPSAVTHPHAKAGPKAGGKVADALVAEARSWLGVPYVLGGKTRAGADCSGFLMAVYRDAAGIELPRTTADQWLRCAPIDRDKAAVGDIIFFSSRKSGGKIAHVGMYVGNGRMIHASSSRGVVEDDLSLKYYVEHYVGTGRVPQIADATPAIEDARKHVPDIIVAPPPQVPPVAATVHLDSLPQLFARAEREKAASEARNSAPAIIVVEEQTAPAIIEVVETPPAIIIPVQTAIATDTIAEPKETPATVVSNAFSKFK